MSIGTFVQCHTWQILPSDNLPKWEQTRTLGTSVFHPPHLFQPPSLNFVSHLWAMSSHMLSFVTNDNVVLKYLDTGTNDPGKWKKDPLILVRWWILSSLVCVNFLVRLLHLCFYTSRSTATWLGLVTFSAIIKSGARKEKTQDKDIDPLISPKTYVYIYAQPSSIFP
jgi:hypothetical protein